MDFMHKLSLSLLAILIAACGHQEGSTDIGNFYPPQIYTDTQHFSISIPVELSDKNGKSSFLYLFEKYGFSGNGPSIEQVVRANVNSPGEYDSEADAFVVYSSNSKNYENLLTELKCIENIECLNSWLKNAQSISLKE